MKLHHQHPTGRKVAAWLAALAAVLMAAACSSEQSAAAPQAAASESAPPAATAAASPEAQFESTMRSFLHDTLDGADFSAMLRSADKRLMRYVHPATTLHRYDNPGAACVDHTAPDWGYAPEMPQLIAIPEQLLFIRGVPNQSDCGDEEASPPADGIYYESVDALPSSTQFSEEDFREVPLVPPAPWQSAPLMHAAVYLQGVRITNVYFAHIQGDWRLVLVDDCVPCSA